MASSSSSISGHEPPDFNVFLSFRIEDTRKFTNYLYDALGRSNIEAFMDDREVITGDEISIAIRRSSLSIIIFSKHYASSSWCLNELLEIIECHKITRGRHKILPIFYHVSPSEIRKQTGTYGEAFAIHEERFKETKGKVQKWRTALENVANLSGTVINHDRPEPEYIDKIVEDVSCMDPGLVGITSRIKRVESLLCIGMEDFRIIGIWGMGGIGKSTIAKAIFHRIAKQFEGVCFLTDVKNEAKKGLQHLQELLLFKIFGEQNLNMEAFMVRRLCSKKILLVIDDVDDSGHLNVLVDRRFFGLGSRIIITSRDRQMLYHIGVGKFELYEVEGLNDREALQLFNENAFKQSFSPEDYMELPRKIVSYCGGNPLALRVLGGSLLGKSMQHWNSLLDKLKKCPNPKIQEVLRISYDELDVEEKEIFEEEDLDRVINILDDCDYSTRSGIDGLLDKRPLTITGNRLMMHDLILEMGRGIVIQESVKEPGKQSRLWYSQDIYNLFKKYKGTNEVESISLDLSQIRLGAFRRMQRLKLLKFYSSDNWHKEMNKVKICEGVLESLSDDLRYLCWHRYPSKSLPFKFNPNHLVALNMSNINLQHLWKDTMSLGSLREIILVGCEQLIEVPDLSGAPNLHLMNLRGCHNLTEFPEISVEIINLNLRGTAIEEIPSFVERFTNLRYLTLDHCRRLKRVSSSIFKLKSMSYSRNFSGCSELEKLPEVLENNREIDSLRLDRSAIKTLPSSIELLSGLEELSLSYCKNLEILPNSLCNLTNLRRLDLSGCFGVEKMLENVLSSSSSGLCSLCWLDLSECGMLVFPSALSCLSSLTCLRLKGNNFESLNLKHFTSLTTLDISYCERLKYLQEFPLPSLLKIVNASHCISLETLPDTTVVSTGEMDISQYFQYYNCLKLDVKAIQTDAQTRIRLMANNAQETRNFSHYWPKVNFCFPGSEIPEWMIYQNEGSSLTIELPPHWYNNNFFGHVLCIVASCDSGEGRCPVVDCTCNFIDYDCAFKENICNMEMSHDMTTILLEHPKSDHVFFSYYEPGEVDSRLSSMYSLCQQVLFQFSPGNDCCKVKRCGVHPVYLEYKDESTDSDDHDIAKEDQEEDSQKRVEQRNIVHEEKMSEILLAQNMSEVRESFSSGFLKPLEDMISSPKVLDFFGSLKLNENWLNGFKSNLQSLGWILGEVESKAYVNKEVKVWLDELDEVSYDLEDLLGEIVTEELSDHQDKSRNIKIQNQGIFSAELSLVEIVEEIIIKIENLQRQSETLGLRLKASRIKREPCQQSVGRDCFEDETHLIGRDEDKEAIIKLLLSDDDHQTHVITIAGERGVGKTTLAQFVYNDERVEKQFDFKAFIHLSDDSDELLLTRAVLDAFTYRCSNDGDLSSLQTSLKEVLKGKKFLLVLDNFTRHSDGGKLQKFLAAGANGSRIIVTERHKKFEDTMGTLSAFTVRSLTKEESWMLFAKHAFPDKNSCLRPELEDIGKEIVEKCRGLPLAAKVLGSVMCLKPVEEWHAVLNNSIFKWDEDLITSFFKMNYYDLPIHLKRCVAYCSIFPTHHEYEEEKLILLWMAEGFLQQKEGTRMQEVGSEYFRNLTYRSFFQPSGANKSCFIMHDLLKDIALVESGFICSRMDAAPLFEVTSKTRHVLISGGRFRFEAICEAKFLRTLILYRSSWNKESYKLSVEQLNDLFEEQQRLRVLSLSRCDITVLPLSIGKLKYLRFLDLSYTAITELPNSVSSLHKLQTLLLSHCSVTKLPENMRELINLWHLDISGTCLKEMPTDMGRLTSLQYLSDFFVGIDSGSKIKELGALSNLRGTLHISQLQNVESAGDASEASLKSKAYLQGLELEWSNVTVDSQNEAGVLEQLEPHKNMEKLSIISYGGTRFPNWLGDSSFFKIVFLRLSNCNSCSHLPPLGQLPSLKELEIERMNAVKMVGPEFYGMKSSSDKPFPSLEILVFREMLEWEEWISPKVEEFPRLKQIRISGCPKLAKCSSLCLPPSAVVQISECPLLRVPVTDDLQLNNGNKKQFGSDDKVAGRPPIHPVMAELQLPDSYGVQRKNEGEIASHSLEHTTDVSSTIHSSPPESSMISTELALPKLPVMVEKQLHEGSSRKEKLLDRPSTSRLSKVEELQLPDINVVQSTDVSVTSNRPTQESPTPLTEDSSAKHEAALDTSSTAAEISSTDDAINVSEISQLKRLPRKLYSLTIESCKAHVSLTEKLMSVNLQQLYIIDCQYLKPIQASLLPKALKTLYIRRCKKLEFPSAEETTGRHTSIENLCIESSCDPLKSFPLALFPKLRNLSICDCANFNSISITEDHMSLKSLEIRDCTNLESLSKSVLRTPKLTSILLSNCQKLKQLPGLLHELTSLQSLFIKECPEIDSIPERGLPSSLNLLRISSCHKLTPCLQWGLQKLKKFIRFEIEGGRGDLESFPEQNLLPMSLNSLEISTFPNLKVLNYEGLQHLTSLRTLKINSCDKLQFLPEEGLPSSLSYLYISDCPLLKSKLQNRGGSEWYKIDHIPHIQIDGKAIA